MLSRRETPLTPEEREAARRQHQIHLCAMQVMSRVRGGWDVIATFAGLNGRTFKAYP